MSCPICHSPRGSNEYCWGHVNSDGTGYLLPFISDMQLIKYKKPKKKRIRSSLKKVTVGRGQSGGIVK